MATKSPKVVIPTVGSLGDVLPCILIGESLKNIGYHVTIAATQKYRKTTEDHGNATMKKRIFLNFEISKSTFSLNRPLEIENKHN